MAPPAVTVPPDVTSSNPVRLIRPPDDVEYVNLGCTDVPVATWA